MEYAGVVPGERESLTEQDPHALLFGHDDEHDEFAGDQHLTRTERRQSRVDRKHHRRVRRHRRMFAVMTSLVLVVIVVVGYVGSRAYENRYHPKDYAGQGTGSVLVQIKAGDVAGDIGATLVSSGVVQTKRAFTNAAAKDSRSQNISPGTYKLRKHMSAKNAVALLLDPTARVSRDVVVFEGATVIDVATPLAKALGVSLAAAKSALADVAALGLPTGYTSDASTPKAVEGFLYPATYTFDPGTSPTEAIQQMITKFIDEDRSSGFAADAKALHITPYEALIIASIAEKEAKVAADFPKVARVILNRLAANTPLQIDATSAYAAKLAKLDPTKIIYNEIKSDYNTYTHDGLPPTPISSPGADALDAAIHPAAGNWLYYVNGDAKGNLYFTNSEAQFERAVEKCRTNHWGCG